MSDHFNSYLMNEVLTQLESQSFFTHIGEERTLSFVQAALALSRYHDGNPGEALAGVGQRLGICYYCWERGDDLRQGICGDCRAADSIGIEPEDAEEWPHPKAAVSYAFIRKETIRQLLQFLPEKIASNLDIRTLRKLPGNCIGWDEDVREISLRFPVERGLPAGSAAPLGDAGADDRNDVVPVPESSATTSPLRIHAFRKPVPQSKC